MEYSFGFDEQETVLIFNRADNCWKCSTNIPAHMNKLEKCGWKKTEDLGYERGYTAPKNAISFRDLTKPKREQTEEQRRASAERLKAFREQRNVQKSD